MMKKWIAMVVLIAAPALANATYIYVTSCGIEVQTVSPDWFEQDGSSEEDAEREWIEWCKELDRHYCGE